MKISVLDGATLGRDIDISPLYSVGEVVSYDTTPDELISERLFGADCAVVNKIKMNESTIGSADSLKLICVAATGFDNIDLEYCKSRGIAVCNVVGYSTDSVAQVTLAMVLSLSTHLREYNDFVNSGEYTRAGIANRLVPTYYELAGKKWGTVGLGNIGGKVAEVASAMGCNVVAYKRTPAERFTCVDIDTLCRECDVITIHTPLNEGTENLINAERIASMKKGAIVVNVARGAVCDENALAVAAEKGDIYLGIDVYTKEPFPSDHPYNKLLGRPNVCLTPHMAWGALDARNRCIYEIAENIKAYKIKKNRNRLV